MNKITTLLILTLTLPLLFVSCKDDGKKENNHQDDMVILDVDDLVNQADNLVDSVVTVEGLCTHICAHGGGKIFLMGSDESISLRAEAGEAIGSFSQETVGSMVRVEGILKENRIDEEYLAQWEAQIAAEMAEKHGEEGESGCSADKKANAEDPSDSVSERIANFRTRIAERAEKEGKAYISLYYLEATSYKILDNEE
ncbi:hypothetical protein QYZ87_02985 [Porphyromonadaceae bacterium W3.11]|nr:hypothetical protein [Porphyromonadaceae bacterium W3.11]